MNDVLLVLAACSAITGAVLSGAALAIALRARPIAPSAPPTSAANPFLEAALRERPAPAIEDSIEKSIEPPAIARSIEHVVDVVERVASLRNVHYVVRRTLPDGDTIVEYDGFSGTFAFAAWVRMERDPAGHPGVLEFLENGHRRGHAEHEAAS